MRSSTQPRPLIHPRFRRLPPPLIVIGMHRSGTSLVAAMLGALGVYMAPHYGPHVPADQRFPVDERLLRDGYAEAVEFRSLNERLLARAHAAWNFIDPFLERRDEPVFAWWSVLLLQAATFGGLQRDYLRPLPPTFCGPWGWKDPRTSLTLPYWLRLFPAARILHVQRDPEATIESLYRRTQAWQQSLPAPLAGRQRVGRWVRHPGSALRGAGRRIGLLPPPARDPSLDRNHCRRLYCQYLQECLQFRAHGDRYLEVWYEEILEDPPDGIRRLAEFARCAPDHSCQVRAEALVLHSRSRVPL